MSPWTKHQQEKSAKHNESIIFGNFSGYSWNEEVVAAAE